MLRAGCVGRLPVSDLLVDLKNSTGLALRLGDVAFHEYLSQFFFEADQAIVSTGGEIVSYVGDAVIVTWPLSDKAVRNAACLSALMTMRRQLADHHGVARIARQIEPFVRVGIPVVEFLGAVEITQIMPLFGRHTVRSASYRGDSRLPFDIFQGYANRSIFCICRKR